MGDAVYSVNARLKASVELSKGKERRQICAIVVPAMQISSGGCMLEQLVTPGQWHNIDGLTQVVNINHNERVLVVCTVYYRANWTDEHCRGRFTLLRDDERLDAEGFGLQSIRCTYSGQAGTLPSATLVMALVDNPPAGPHLYSVATCITAQENLPDASISLEGHSMFPMRQLSLLRLAADDVVGPFECQGVSTVDEDCWTEVHGLSVTVEVRNQWTKVLIICNTNFDPSKLMYEVYVTLFRRREKGGTVNLGHEDTGIWSAASNYCQSSEFPQIMFIDVPGTGSHSYSVAARTRRCDVLLEPPLVEIGPQGQISAVLLQSTDHKRM